MSYKVGQAVCDACQHEWVAVLQGEEVPLECPNCGEMKGRFCSPGEMSVDLAEAREGS